MSDIKDILEQMIDVDKDHSRWFFNLVEVLSRKGVLNINDMDYIRHHDEKQQGEQEHD